MFVSGYNSLNDTIYICEGPNNALSFVEIGHSAIATFGAGNLPTPYLLRKYIENKTVILAGDGDDAGDNFNTQLALLILENKIPVKDLQKIKFPDGKDANDLLLSNELPNYSNICKITDFDKIKETFQAYIIEKEKQQPESCTLPTSYNEQTQQEIETNELEEEKIFNTEFLPESIYENLPEILKECTDLFQDSIEKDVFLIGAIGVLSACLPNIEGTYFVSEYSAHLFVFITAPAGSGKGSLKWAKFFGQIIHDKMVEQSEKDKAE